MISLAVLALAAASQIPESGIDPTIAAVIAAGAAVVRLLLALFRSPLLGGGLDKLPRELRPLIPLALAAAAALLDHLAAGGDLARGLLVAFGVFSASELTYRVQHGREKTRADAAR
jgi:hypothetical protein